MCLNGLSTLLSLVAISLQSQVVVSAEGALEARGWLMAQGLDEGLAEKLSRLGLDAIAQASEAQLVDEGLSNLKARHIHQLLRERSVNVQVRVGTPLTSNRLHSKLRQALL